MYRSIPLSNYSTQGFRCLHAMHRCKQAAQSLNILFRLAPPCMHITWWLHKSMKCLFCLCLSFFHTHQSASIFLWLLHSVPLSTSPQETLPDHGGEDEDVIIYVLFNNTTQKSLFVRFIRLLWDLRFLQHCCWQFRCSGTWCSVSKWTVSSTSSVGNEKCIQKSRQRIWIERTAWKT